MQPQRVHHSFGLQAENSDLRPYADRIVAETLRRLDHSHANGEPFVLLLDEDHRMPSNSILTLLVLTKLKERGLRVTLGQEIDHDMLLTAFCQTMDFLPSECVPNALDILKRHDPDGALTAKAHIFANDMPESPLARNLLSVFALENNIPLILNDASIDRNDDLLNLSDPSTLEAAQDTFFDIDMNRDIHARGAHGVTIRNYLMINKLLEHAESHSADVCVQLVGSLHIAGDTDEDCKFEDSLSGILKAHNYPVLAVNIPQIHQKYIPQDHKLGPDELICDLQIPQSMVDYEDEEAGDAAAYEIYEKRLVSALSSASGIDFNPDIIPHLKNRFEDELTSLFLRIAPAIINNDCALDDRNQMALFNALRRNL